MTIAQDSMTRSQAPFLSLDAERKRTLIVAMASIAIAGERLTSRIGARRFPQAFHALELPRLSFPSWALLLHSGSDYALPRDALQ